MYYTFINCILALGSLALYYIIVGLFGLIAYHRNVLLMLIALELMLLGVSLYFIYLAHTLIDEFGYLVAILLLVLAGSESALGLALTMLIYRLKNTIQLEALAQLKH